MLELYNQSYDKNELSFPLLALVYKKRKTGAQIFVLFGNELQKYQWKTQNISKRYLYH